MAYLYVKSGLGTCTDGTGRLTQQTGAFGSGSLTAANVYARLSDAFNNCSAGDIILVSDSHAFSGAPVTYGSPGANSNVPAMCVSDAACDSYSSGGSETYNSTQNITGNITFIGLTLDFTSLYPSTTNGGMFRFRNSTLKISSYILPNAPGFLLRFEESNLVWKGVGSYPLYSYQFSLWEIENSTAVSEAGGDGFVNSLIQGNFIRPYFKINNCDLTIVDGNLCDGWGSGKGNGIVQITNCKLNSSVSFTNNTLVGSGQRLIVQNSSSSSAAAEYQYYQQSNGCLLQEDTSIYRDSSIAMSSGQKLSLKITTTSAPISMSDPFYFEFPDQFIELSNAASDVLKFYLLSNVSLTDADIWINVAYRDGTNKNVPDNVFSVTDPEDILRTGTGLTTNTETWTGRTTQNRYEISVDTGSHNPGTDMVPVITVYVAKVNAILHVCHTIEAS